MAITPDPHAVRAYLDGQPDDTCAALEHVRTVVLQEAEGAEERISYGIITFRRNGRDLVGLGAGRGYLGLYTMDPPLMARLRPELADLQLSGKSTLRFTAERPLPDDVVRRIVRERLAAG